MKHVLRLLSIRVIGLILLISACADDDSDPKIDVTVDDIFVLEVRNSPSDVSGSMIVLDSLPSGEIDPSNFGATASSAQFGEGIVFGKAIYRERNLQNDLGIYKLEVNATGQLVESGFIAGNIQFGIISENKGYYWNPDLNEKALQIFDPTAMQRTGEIDLSDAIDTYANHPSVTSISFNSFMESANGTFFTQVDFFDDSGLRTYDSSFVMAINETTDDFIAWVIYPEPFALGFGSYLPNYTLYVEEDGYLYLSTWSGKSFFNIDPITLRINVNDLAFDLNWNIYYTSFAGGPAFISGGGVHLNGKLYALVMSESLAADFSNFGVNMQAVEIDIATQAINRIQGIPTVERGSPVSPTVYQDKVYFPHQGESGNPNFSYYTYDPANQATEKIFSLSSGLIQKLYFIE